MSWKANFRNHVSHTVVIPPDGTLPRSVTWIDHASRLQRSMKAAVFEVDSGGRPYQIGVRKTSGTGFLFLNTEVLNGDRVGIRIPNDAGEAYAVLASDQSIYLPLRLIEVATATVLAKEMLIL